MTTKEREFMAEIKALLDKYQVRFFRDATYYPGDDENPRLRLGCDQEQSANVITLDDIADMRGGFTEY